MLVGQAASAREMVLNAEAEGLRKETRELRAKLEALPCQDEDREEGRNCRFARTARVKRGAGLQAGARDMRYQRAKRWE